MPKCLSAWEACDFGITSSCRTFISTGKKPRKLKALVLRSVLACASPVFKEDHIQVLQNLLHGLGLRV